MTPLNGIKLDKVGGKSLPLYEQIRRQIKESIKARTIKPGDRLPTMASLVKLWDVDYSTIKAAFDLLAEDGVIKLEPRKGAVVTGEKRTNVATIMFIRWGADAFVIDIADGIRQYCTETNQNFICTDARLSPDIYLDAISHPPKDVNGLVLIPLNFPEHIEAIAKTVQNGIKMVFVDRVLPDIPVSSVTADHFAAGFRATTHLLELHKKPVVFFGMKHEPTSCQERSAGWAAAMRQHNYHSLEEYIWRADSSETDPDSYISDVRQMPKKCALEFMRKNPQDGYSVLACNDAFAQGLYLAAEELNLTIGKDIHVVGVGDMPYCAVSKPPQSSVYQPRKQLGYEAAKLVHQDILGQISRPTHRILPTQLNIRASSDPQA
ncbi:MAG: GntR family transcriptional regulator [Sedimentisphaerales bacterium]|nr:GntR family transcriptional regulator [Sedimentisphaerales bacterium]